MGGTPESPAVSKNLNVEEYLELEQEKNKHRVLLNIFDKKQRQIFFSSSAVRTALLNGLVVGLTAFFGTIAFTSCHKRATLTGAFSGVATSLGFYFPLRRTERHGLTDFKKELEAAYAEKHENQQLSWLTDDD